MPWQLAEAKSWPRLSSLLAEPSFLMAAWEADEFAVQAYWSRIERESPLRLMDAYRPLLDLPDLDPRWLQVYGHIGYLLNISGNSEDSLRLFTRVVEHYRRAGDLFRLAGALGQRAFFLRELGDLEEALKDHEEEKRICQTITRGRGEGRTADRSVPSPRASRDRLAPRSQLAASLLNQGWVYYCKKDFDRAWDLFEKAERECHAANDRWAIAHCVASRATILLERKDLGAAMTLFLESESISRQFADKKAVQASLGNRAIILIERRDLDGATELLKEQERICRELGYSPGLIRSLGNQATVLRDRGYWDRAMDLYEKVESLCRANGHKIELALTLAKRARILEDLGEFREALGLLKEAEELAARIGDETLVDLCRRRQNKMMKLLESSW